MVHDVWVDVYKHKELPVAMPLFSTGEKRPAFHNPFQHNAFKKRTVQVEQEVRAIHFAQGLDEYEVWCGDETQKVDYCADPISYWHEKRHEYPLLSEMALNFLIMQPMSAEC